MKKVLIIVESPSKAKTLSKFLPKNYIVKASLGHVIDLPEHEFGVDIKNDFKPKFEIMKGKGKVIKELKKLAREVDEILLASDPDREGESIAYHLYNILFPINKNIYRIRFHEITKEAILKAIENKDKIDINKVYAQFARRILDRIVGYTISPLISKYYLKALSAGRVQSVALRLIVEREKEIENFVPERYYKIFAYLNKDNKEIEFELKKYKGKSINKKSLKTKEKVFEVLKDLYGETFSYEVKKRKSKVKDSLTLELEDILVKTPIEGFIEKIEKKEEKKSPPPPFITSTLQMEAAKKFNFSPEKTMKIAQSLYEGKDIGKERVGLITYMRTDSFRIAEKAIKEARNFIKENFGESYLPSKKRTYEKKQKGKIQDAHECIRPTNVYLTPEKVKPYLSKEEYLLYKLIWERFVACQMKDAIFEKQKIFAKVKNAEFVTSQKTLKFDGFLKVLKEEDDKSILTPFEEGEKLEFNKLLARETHTTPPERYTEGSLVKTLEKYGVGRPSTYATIISNILKRGYVEKKKKSLIPTELGVKVNDILIKHFEDIINPYFTAEVEEDLDKIEEGEKNHIQVLKEFYFGNEKYSFEKLLKQAKVALLYKDKIVKKCPKCGSYLVIREGKYGKFLGCLNYPNCKYTEKYEEKDALQNSKKG